MNGTAPNQLRWHYEVLLDHGETPNKCTIAPLAYRDDFNIRKIASQPHLAPLASDYLLHPDGISIAAVPRHSHSYSLAAIDCVWRRLSPILETIEAPLPTPLAIPPGFVTAYPRRSHPSNSKTNVDPASGLATIEAIFIAATLLGHWDPTLLSEYFFGARFVEINRKAFALYGIELSSDQAPVVFAPKLPRNSQSRRINRGQRCTSINQI